MARSGAEGKVQLALPVVGEGSSVYIDMCVTDWGHTPSQKTQPSNTTCNYDPIDGVMYEDEDVVSRGCEFEFTGFYEGDDDIDGILQAKYLGKVALRRVEGNYLLGNAAVIKSIAYAGTTDNLQTFKVSAKIKGKFWYGATATTAMPTGA